MLIKVPNQSFLTDNDTTDENIYLSRRNFIKNSSLLAATPFLSNLAFADNNLKASPYETITSYNNFYEFGTGKADPKKYAGTLKTANWQITIDGACEKPGIYNLEDVLKAVAYEERIYRFRCVEAWSMVIPWNGYQLSKVLEKFQPTSKAKFVRFETLADAKTMPGVASKFSTIPYPYVEGLRMDEAMNKLAFLATGIYGKEIPNQNGAPIRLVLPWKYGFKSIKSIVKISFVENESKNTWQLIAPREYGFYANVNPNVNHPRWSQATERLLPNRLFADNSQQTLMFNGYADEVAHLYTNLDLTKNY